MVRAPPCGKSLWQRFPLGSRERLSTWSDLCRGALVKEWSWLQRHRNLCGLRSLAMTIGLPACQNSPGIFSRDYYRVALIAAGQIEMRFSFFNLARNAVNGHRDWPEQWRSPEPKPSYETVIVGAGGQGLGTASYLAKEHHDHPLELHPGGIRGDLRARQEAVADAVGGAQLQRHVLAARSRRRCSVRR